MNTNTLELDNLSAEERELLDLLLKKEGLDLSQLPIPRRNESGPTPLSFTQERLWAAGMLAPDLPYGNVEMTFRLKGLLNAAALKQACKEVAGRHEILRTTFQLCNGQARQIVHPDCEIPFLEEDLRSLPKASRFDEAIRRATEATRKPFNLNSDYLLRVGLWQIDSGDFLLSFITHHLATDGWGMRILLQDVAAYYKAEITRSTPELPDLPIQYADFSIWQKQWLSGEVLETQKNYWKDQLKGAPSELVLSHGHRKPTTPTFKSESLSFEFSAETTEALRALSRKEGVTLYTTLLACFQTLLHCHSKQKDLIVGTTVSNRNRSESERMIGNFGNNLLLRANYSEDPTFRQFLTQVRDTVLEASAHQDLPLELLMTDTNGDGSNFIVPQFQTMFVLRDSTLEENLTLPGITVESLGLDVGIAPLDLKMDIIEAPDTLSGVLEYKVEVFDATVMKEMTEDFSKLVERFAANPDERISSIGSFITSRTNGHTAPIVVITEPQNQTITRSEYVPPRDNLEIQLTNIWEKVIGKRPIGVRDSFFSLGHSLMAVKLFAQIEKVFGHNLPLATLFQAPTIEKMAALFRQEGWKPPWSSLVPIQPNGSRPPLYCVHGGGGNVLSFQALAKHLGHDQPLFGLQSPGLDGRPPFTRVEEMAEHYLRDIRAHQPKGPYYLEGMSFGGMVAYEMAQRLIKEGEDVGLLALLDTYPTGYKKILPKSSFLRRFELKVAEILAMQPDQKRRFMSTRLGGFAGKLSSKAKKLAAKLHLPVEPPITKAIRSVREANFMAADRYIPEIYPGKATFFWAKDSFINCTYKFRVAWSLLVPEGLEMHIVPGTHSSMFEEPNVQVLAAKLNECLQKSALYHAHGKKGPVLFN